MSRWLVTHGESQFSAQDLAELKTMAQTRRIQPADLIQPPGASDWLYAFELPELKAAFPDDTQNDDDDDGFPSKSLIPRPVIMTVLIGIILGGIYTMWDRWGILQSIDITETGLSSDEALLNQDVEMRSEPGAQLGSTIAKLKEGDTVTFQLKQMNLEHGNWWKVSADDKQGWIPAEVVPPTYLFDEKARKSDKALYFPEDFIKIDAPTWKALDGKLYGDGADDHVRIVDLKITNTSKYEMTDVVIAIELLGKKGEVLESARVELEKPLPATSTDLPVGAIFPEIELPDVSNVSDRVLKKKLEEKIEKIDDSDLAFLQSDCGPLQVVFNMPDLMKRVDYQTHDELRVLDTPKPKTADKPERWRSCFDVELDLDVDDIEGIDVRLYQVRANPSSNRTD